MHSLTGRRLGALAAALYLLAVAVIDVLRSAGEGPFVRALASSPSGVAHGHVARLATSGLIIAGDPGPQIVGSAAIVLAAIVLLGPAIFWWAALVGHVVATLVAYAGVGLLWLLDRSLVARIADAPDYGISCVVAGSIGVLVAAVLRDRPRRELVLAGAALSAIALATPSGDALARVEHALALGLATLLGYELRHRRHRAGAPTPV